MLGMKDIMASKNRHGLCLMELIILAGKANILNEAIWFLG